MSEEKITPAAPNRIQLAESISSSVDELSRLERDTALEIAETRTILLKTLRFNSLRLTNPGDWTLFKTRDGYITGFLEDSGCERVRPLWGISITRADGPSREEFADGVYAYYFVGDGNCSFTGGSTIGVEGFRTSIDDFCKDDREPLKTFKVRKAARANLDGGIVRELAGLANVPITELEEAWTGTNKATKDCAKGRGFGKKEERSENISKESRTTSDMQMVKDGLMKSLLKIPKDQRSEFVEKIHGAKDQDELFEIEMKIKERMG